MLTKKEIQKQHQQKLIKIWVKHGVDIGILLDYLYNSQSNIRLAEQKLYESLIKLFPRYSYNELQDLNRVLNVDLSRIEKQINN